MNQLAYNWWTVALRGVLAIVVGLIGFCFPSVTLAVIIAFFGFVRGSIPDYLGYMVAPGI